MLFGLAQHFWSIRSRMFCQADSPWDHQILRGDMSLWRICQTSFSADYLQRCWREMLSVCLPGVTAVTLISFTQKDVWCNVSRFALLSIDYFFLISCCRKLFRRNTSSQINVLYALLFNTDKAQQPLFFQGFERLPLHKFIRPPITPAQIISHFCHSVNLLLAEGEGRTPGS